MTAHIVMPARRSHVPGQLVRRCTAAGCQWTAYDSDRDALDAAAQAHHDDPDGDTARETP